MRSSDKSPRRTGMTGFVAPTRSPLRGLGRVRVVRVPQPANENVSEKDRSLFRRIAAVGIVAALLLGLAAWRAFTAF